MNSMTLIGTSGYSFKWWEFELVPGIKPFYEKGDMLQQYIKHFDFLELNCTFYKTPSLKTVLEWKDKTPDNFTFIVKVNNSMTQYKKLVEFDVRFPEFVDLMSNLGKKLKGFLIQLPPNFTNSKNKSKVDGMTPLERVIWASDFTKKKYPELDIFVEFRHPSWFCEKVYDAIRDKWSLVVVNAGIISKKMTPGFWPPLSDFPQALTVPGKIYFRNHGPWATRHYSGSYSDDDLVLMLSLFQEKTIVAFDNTDAFDCQCEFQPFPGKMMFEKEIYQKSHMLPHAVLDAKRMQKLIK
jgi:uncharacterized protein YecE (DUF72 family)